MSRANLGVFEADLSAILEAVNELVHLELLTDTEFAANVNFLSLRNLASNELFFRILKIIYNSILYS